MQWRDEGIVLSARPHGENAAIVEVFTPDRGRHFGIVNGGTSRRKSPHLQAGTRLDLTWRARLEEHIGVFAIEPRYGCAARAMSGRLSLAGLNAVCALLRFCLPERDPHPALYTRTREVLDHLGEGRIWPLIYLHWELVLLEETGFGLDLGSCAVTGGKEGLAYISPKSGRAVSRNAAGQWADRLLPMPKVLLGRGAGEIADIVPALAVTGFFLERRLAPGLGGKPLPEARGRLLGLLDRRAREAGTAVSQDFV